MQVMIWTELKKLRRSRMLLVALFGLCMVLVIVTAQGFFAGGNEAYGMEPEWYLTGDRKSTRLNSSHANESRMPSSA